MRSILLAGAALFCTQIALIPTANAADREFCENYAHRAREQTERAREHQCWRSFDMHNSRWESNYEEHFHWCRDVDRRAAERETEIRRDELRRCGL